MSNFNIRYECLDAQDDYRALLIKDANAASNLGVHSEWIQNDDTQIDDDNMNFVHPTQDVDVDRPIDFESLCFRDDSRNKGRSRAKEHKQQREEI
ncbi:hypothetical protein AAF712_016598 [Marasmius tenuissimus]|uniref:Uncharacterized protein n=1 Tax=Marasmius tenuissimus TaxID=585030 RepID=A0ABR2Z5D0_9AGAR